MMSWLGVIILDSKLLTIARSISLIHNLCCLRSQNLTQSVIIKLSCLILLYFADGRYLVTVNAFVNAELWFHATFQAIHRYARTGCLQNPDWRLRRFFSNFFFLLKKKCRSICMAFSTMRSLQIMRKICSYFSFCKQTQKSNLTLLYTICKMSVWISFKCTLRNWHSIKKIT